MENLTKPGGGGTVKTKSIIEQVKRGDILQQKLLSV